MKWEKFGLVYAPSGQDLWAREYAHLPTPYLLNDKVIRVYFSALDEQQFGRVGYVDLDSHDPSNILRISDKPVLDLGPLGSFDDSGVTPSCVVDVGHQQYMYFIGWQRADAIQYRGP